MPEHTTFLTYLLSKFPALQHKDAPPGPSQIGGRGQAVVPSADHDRVPVPGGEIPHGHRQPNLAEARGDPVHADAGSRSRSASM